MHSNTRVTLVFLAAALRAGFAFNPIHESSYNLEPRGMFPSAATFSIAGVVDSRATGVWTVPASIAFKASSQVELGAGLRTVWGDAGNHVPYLIFGIKFLPAGATTYQADLLVPASGREKGFSVAAHHRFGYGGILFSRLAARAGFMEALTRNHALMAFEGGFYPTLAFGALSLEAGLIASSQTRDFEGNLAMDLQPGLIVAFSRASTLQASVAMGLAGDQKEEMRAKLLLNHGF